MTTTQSHNESEVARLRAAIIDEHEAGQRALHEFAAGTQRHDFITAKQQRIGEHFETLKTMMPPDDAMALIAEALASVDVGGNHATSH